MTRPFEQLPAPQQAGILCNDDRFRRFVAVRLGLTTSAKDPIQSSLAAEYIRNVCQIPSRSDLATSNDAQQKFAALRTEFDAWTGKIARPR